MIRGNELMSIIQYMLFNSCIMPDVNSKLTNLNICTQYTYTYVNALYSLSTVYKL